jgi:hypothetical protein
MNNDIDLLKKLLDKKEKKHLSDLLKYSYSELHETSTYGSRLYSTLSSFKIYSPILQNEKLKKLQEEEYQTILECVRIIYPLKDNSPEITNIEFFVDPLIELKIEEENKNKRKLSMLEIIMIVNKYIGVKEGYLGDFSYQTHAEFYPYYCDLEIDPNDYNGTTRYRFIEILKKSSPENQAKILKGVLKKYPVDFFNPQEQMEKEVLHLQIKKIINRLEGGRIIESPNLVITNSTIERAMDDIKVLIEKRDVISVIDRIHTVFHGFLKEVCKTFNIIISEDSSITEIYKKIRGDDRILNKEITRNQEIDKILKAFASIIDNLNPIRNKASIAHANEELLGEDEAILCVNSVVTMLTYLNSIIKIS